MLKINKIFNFFKSKNKSKGFTLVEMLVAISVFSVLLLVVTNIFILTSKAHKNIILKQKIANDISLALSLLSEKIRVGDIYYQYPFYLNGIQNPTEILALKDKDERIIIFRQSSELCPAIDSSPCLQFSSDQGDNWNNITSQGIRVKNLNFYIDPPFSPFAQSEDNFYKRQPKVTIVLELENATNNKNYKNSTAIQTTITTRTYKER